VICVLFLVSILKIVSNFALNSGKKKKKKKKPLEEAAEAVQVDSDRAAKHFRLNEAGKQKLVA
jgi:hypothetical protein